MRKDIQEKLASLPVADDLFSDLSKFEKMVNGIIAKLCILAMRIKRIAK